jgi:hypothetical protein
MEILKVNNKRKRDNNEKYSNKHIIPIIIIIRYHFVQEFLDLSNWPISLAFIAVNKLLKVFIILIDILFVFIFLIQLINRNLFIFEIIS